MTHPHTVDPIKVLLVEDDEDDFVLTSAILAEIPGKRFQVEWQRTFAAGLEAMTQHQPDVCLIDYRLGTHDGIALLRVALEGGCRAPIILLTGQRDRDVDLAAMKAGASDYLVKGRIDATSLERAIRYAIERKRATDQAASEQARLAAFGEDVGLALSRRDSRAAILRRCAAAMAHYLDVERACVWVCESENEALVLEAAAGRVADPGEKNETPSRRDFPLQSLETIKPIVIQPLIGDARLSGQEWFAHHHLKSCAIYPLVLEERLLGALVVYARRSLGHSIILEMASVANGVASFLQRKRSEIALDASEIRYRNVVESVKEIIFQTDQEGRWTFLNRAWSEMTGFKTEESIGQVSLDFLHPDDRQLHLEMYHDLMEGRRPSCGCEVRYRAADGTFRWMDIDVQPLLGPQKRVIGASGTLRDVTDRKRAEAEIEKLAAFARYNPNPVLELAAEGTLTYLNDAARATAQTLAVATPEAILPLDSAAIACSCLRTGQSRHQLPVVLNGRTLHWSFFPIVASQVVHCYGVDITDRLSLESRLLHAQKLESVGQLAAGVAHDFNNILTVVQGHSDLLIGRYDGDDAIVGSLKEISAAARRGSALTSRLLLFSRKQALKPKVLDLNALVLDVNKMLRRLLGEHIATETCLAPKLPAIEADAGMMDQVVMNLAVNARDAMPKGGRLMMSTCVVEVDAKRALQVPDARAGQFVRLSVADSGCGMSAEVQQKIFEPFFTTKPAGVGTGLGLATVYGIVKQHQGWIEVESEVNRGTTFHLFLPASAKCLEAVIETPAKPAEVIGGSETILLVEDEPVLRELVSSILQGYHYHVIEAGTGMEAIKLWEGCNGRVDLLLTDMVMPEGMSGRELADQLKLRDPKLKVVFTSGYTAEYIGADLSRQDIKFLAKPYPPPQLARTVRECLDF